MKKQYKIRGITLHLHKDPENGVMSCYEQRFFPWEEFLEILEPEIKKIAKKAAAEVIRDRNDCG